jgi:hypothetical protein
MGTADSFQPLIPEEHILGGLLDQASALTASAYHLVGQASPTLLGEFSGWLRAMNSYYTNKIEGQHTLPAAIERAMRRDFDADADMQRKQRLALAHIEAEQALERQFVGANPDTWFSPGKVQAIHEALYSRLPEVDRVTDDGKPIPGHPSTR